MGLSIRGTVDSGRLHVLVRNHARVDRLHSQAAPCAEAGSGSTRARREGPCLDILLRNRFDMGYEITYSFTRGCAD